MGSDKTSLNPEAKKSLLEPNAKIIEWEELQQELARLWSLSLALSKAKEKKASLVQTLEPFIKVRTASLHQSNEIQDIKQKLEAKKQLMGNLLTDLKNAKEDLQLRKEQQIGQSRVLLIAAKSQSAALNQLQEAKLLLDGEMGHVHLKELQKMLWKRHQHMFKQVSTIYPLKVLAGRTPDVALNELHPNGSAAVDSTGSSSSETSIPCHEGLRHLTILGLQLHVPPSRKSSFFSDKQEIQTTASALGYVAHVPDAIVFYKLTIVTAHFLSSMVPKTCIPRHLVWEQTVALVASYLDIPLRYPLRLGGSRSYILDPAPFVEAVSSDPSSSSTIYSSPRPTGFPLFLEGHETTRSAYAIFLLNKNIEQLLNSIGVQSLGPRHVLANLKELFRRVQSRDYAEMMDASSAS